MTIAGLGKLDQSAEAALLLGFVVRKSNFEEPQVGHTCLRRAPIDINTAISRYCSITIVTLPLALTILVPSKLSGVHAAGGQPGMGKGLHSTLRLV